MYFPFIFYIHEHIYHLFSRFLTLSYMLYKNIYSANTRLTHLMQQEVCHCLFIINTVEVFLLSLWIPATETISPLAQLQNQN